MRVLTNTSGRVRIKHLSHFISGWSAILKLFILILCIWNHCSSCIKMPPLQKKGKERKKKLSDSSGAKTDVAQKQRCSE